MEISEVIKYTTIKVSDNIHKNLLQIKINENLNKMDDVISFLINKYEVLRNGSRD